MTSPPSADSASCTRTHHVEQLRSLDADEVDACLVGDRLGQQRLAAAGRTAEQDTGRRGETQLLVVVRVPHRVLTIQRRWGQLSDDWYTMGAGLTSSI